MTAPTIIDKVQITKDSATLNKGTSPVNPHDSAHKPKELKEFMKTVFICYKNT